ncbi:MAG: LL-diaminopimelate aminotransferase [Phycisphaerae bacterium]
MPFKPPSRLTALPSYLFVEIDRRKRAAIEAGKDVINFGVGDPDRPTFEYIVDAMRRAVGVPSYHRYPAGAGSVEFRASIAAFFEKRYRVRLDPESEVLALIGSKEGLGHLPLAVLEPGDQAIIPDPAYPVYQAGTLFAGGVPWTLTLREDAAWIPDLDAIPLDVARAAKLLFLNYPNNPTGAVCSREFLERAVAFCKRHDIILAQDAAYNEMYFDTPAPSVLEIGDAHDVAIEFHSLSKTFGMTGWRIGFAVGRADVLAALAKIKNNLDSGPFTAIQEAAQEAYAGMDRPEHVELRRMYRERSEVMSDGLREIGFRVAPPRATFYVWAGVPHGHDAMGVATRLLEEAAVVCIPGAGFGVAGEGYVRFAMTVEISRVREALRRMRSLKW